MFQRVILEGAQDVKLAGNQIEEALRLHVRHLEMLLAQHEAFLQQWLLQLATVTGNLDRITFPAPQPQKENEMQHILDSALGEEKDGNDMTDADGNTPTNEPGTSSENAGGGQPANDTDESKETEEEEEEEEDLSDGTEDEDENDEEEADESSKED